MMSRRNKSQEAKEIMTGDAFSNPLFRLGYGSQSPLEATEYPLTRMTDNYALLNSLYRGNWVVQNVVGIIPDDMTKKGITLTGSFSPKQQADFRNALKCTGLIEKINTGLKWGRLYGGAAGLILIRGQENMLDKPLDINAVMPGAFRGIYIVDRWCGITPDMELVNDAGDPDFGLPKYYTINGEGSRTIARVHYSRIIRFTGRELPYLEKLAELYWGESEIEAIYDDIVKHDNVSANMAGLTFRANVDTMEVQNLEQLFSTRSIEQQKRFWNMMQAQSVVKSNFGMQLVDKDSKITNTQYTFTGLKDVYESMCLDLSGATRIPVTKLFGRSPAGLNATGESDLQNYYDYIDSLREGKLKPIIYKILPVLLMSALGTIPEDADVAFPPLWTPTAKEISDIAKAKSETIINAFQAGLIDQATAQKELKKLSEETGLFDSITDEEIKANKGRTFQDVTALKDPLSGLDYEDDFDSAVEDEWMFDGGKGSGNFGHVGRPGLVGGSGGGSLLEQAISNGTVSTKLNKKAQAKHKKGSKEYNEALARGEHPSYTELSNMEVQKLINTYSTKSKTVEEINQFKEVLTHNTDFGYFYNELTASYEPTNKATIHYSKKGTHLVPTHKY